jgi:Lon protease-like protein
MLPLFPLDVVLLPGTPLPLHIFEPRYKEMIGECLAEKKPFGILRAQGESVAEIGCTAEILEVLKRYPDGKLDISTIGRRRFEVLEVNNARSFLQAEVQFLEDEPSTPNKESIERALALHRQILEAIGEEQDVQADAPQLSYMLAGALPIDLDFKQSLLAVRSEGERIEGLVEFYEAILPKIRKAARRRQKAGGNGHVP